MEKIYYSIDRFEEDFAILINCFDNSKHEIAADILQTFAKEGDIVCLENGIYTLEKDLTLAKQNETSALLDDLWK